MDLFEKCLLTIWPMQPLYPLTAFAVCCTDWFWIWKKKPIQYLDVLPYLFYSLSSSHDQPSSSSPWSVSTRCTSQVPVEITSLFLITLWLHFPFPEKRSHLQTSIETQTSWRPCPDLQGSSPLCAWPVRQVKRSSLVPLQNPLSEMFPYLDTVFHIL